VQACDFSELGRTAGADAWVGVLLTAISIIWVARADCSRTLTRAELASPLEVQRQALAKRLSPTFCWQSVGAIAVSGIYEFKFNQRT
jgi:hypothetical protein